MRIVGGQHRGRILDGPGELDIRPTSDRARESLFNILEHGRFTKGGVSPLHGARVLDAFCGTGALGLEALSRGAARATFIDRDRAALAIARGNAKKVGVTTAEFVTTDASEPPRASAPHDIAFLDPPYGEDLGLKALAALARAGWLAAGGLAVVESGPRDLTDAPEGFTAEDTRRYGKARLTFYRFLTIEKLR